MKNKKVNEQNEAPPQILNNNIIGLNNNNIINLNNIYYNCDIFNYFWWESFLIGS